MMHRMWLTFVQCKMPKKPSTKPLFCVYVNHFPARIPEHIWFLNPNTYILSTKPQAMSSPGKREQQFVFPTVPIPRTVGAPVGFSSLLHNVEHFLRNMHMFMPCCVWVLVVFIHNIQGYFTDTGAIDCRSAIEATLNDIGKYTMWIHNKTRHNTTLCICYQTNYESHSYFDTYTGSQISVKSLVWDNLWSVWWIFSNEYNYVVAIYLTPIKTGVHSNQTITCLIIQIVTKLLTTGWSCPNLNSCHYPAVPFQTGIVWHLYQSCTQVSSQWSDWQFDNTEWDNGVAWK